MASEAKWLFNQSAGRSTRGTRMPMPAVLRVVLPGLPYPPPPYYYAYLYWYGWGYYPPPVYFWFSGVFERRFGGFRSGFRR